jgi:nicotinamidase-related amidase
MEWPPSGKTSILANMSNLPEESEQDWPLHRSPELMNAEDTGLLVVDVQKRLLPLVPGHAKILWNIERLLAGTEALGIPRAATEQNPDRLGGTIEELADQLDSPSEKLAFSCLECRAIFDRWRKAGIFRVLLCGIETHVCIGQTALDLMSAGFRVYVAVDAVGARYEIDHEVALRRIEGSGATLTTTEAALFEWCQVAGTAEFRAIIELAKQKPPG